jgi:hypothetical protein
LVPGPDRSLYRYAAWIVAIELLGSDLNANADQLTDTRIFRTDNQQLTVAQEQPA